jgi:hypothetical protein
MKNLVLILRGLDHEEFLILQNKVASVRRLAASPRVNRRPVQDHGIWRRKVNYRRIKFTQIMVIQVKKFCHNRKRDLSSVNNPSLILFARDKPQI